MFKEMNKTMSGETGKFNRINGQLTKHRGEMLQQNIIVLTGMRVERTEEESGGLYRSSL